jgi:RimJ/RimL family protein N-acetyltransferase
MKNAEEWGKIGFLEYAGWYLEKNILQKINKYCEKLNNKKLRRNKYKIGRSVIDGKGSIRIIKDILYKFFLNFLILRNVVYEDAHDIYKLSNDDLVRKNSFNSKEIKWYSHLLWFKQKLQDEKVVHFAIVDDCNKFYGQVRFDLYPKNNEAIINISLSPTIRGLGLSSFLINNSIEKVIKNKKLRIIKAYIKPNNIPSISAFKKAGFYFFEKQLIDENKSNVYIKEV